jgi:WD40 repeat protein
MEAVRQFLVMVVLAALALTGTPASAGSVTTVPVDGFTYSTAVSANGKQVWAGTANGRVFRYNTCSSTVMELRRQGEFPYQTHAHEGSVRMIRIAPNGRLVATAGGDKMVRVWDTRTGKLKDAFVVVSYAEALAWSPDGKYLAIGVAYVSTEIWNVRLGRLVRSIPISPGGLYPQVKFLDRDRVVQAETSGDVRVWSVKYGHVATWRAHESGVYAMDADSNGRIYTAGGYANQSDTNVRVWQVGKGRNATATLVTVLPQPVRVYSLLLTDRGRKIITGDVLGVARTYSVNGFVLEDTYEIEQGSVTWPIRSIGANSNGSVISLADGTPNLTIWTR